MLWHLIQLRPCMLLSASASSYYSARGLYGFVSGFCGVPSGIFKGSAVCSARFSRAHAGM